MRNTWFLFVAPIILFAVIAAVLFKRRNKNPKKKTAYRPLANTKMTRDLPEYAKARKKYHLLLAGVAVLFLLIFGSSAVLVARPVSVSVGRPAYENRDIMFCLDVSGSMNSYIEGLSDGFIELINGFKGQRFGITIFDGIYMTISPLTDDYDSTIELLESLKTNLSKYNLALGAAQTSVSEIGPGLVGCINGFDKLGDEERTRVVILATDNYASPTQAVNLTQAANYAKRYGVTVYGFSTTDFPCSEKAGCSETKTSKEFREATLLTGGSYYAMRTTTVLNWNNLGKSDANFLETTESTKNAINSIMAQAAARSEGVETLIRSDDPLPATIVLLVSLICLFVIIWRLGL